MPVPSQYECPQERLAKELLPAIQALLSRMGTGPSAKISDSQTALASAIFVVHVGDQPVAKITVPATASLKLRDGKLLDMGDIHWFECR